MPALHDQDQILRSDRRGQERTRNRLQRIQAMRLEDPDGGRIDAAARLGRQTGGEHPAAIGRQPGTEQGRRDRTAAKVARADDV